MKRVFNLRPDVSDQRDYLFKDHFKVSRVLPKSVSLRRYMGPVEDQGELGSCTANAFAGVLEYLYLKNKDKFQASRLFIYFNERQYINEIHNDSGAYLRDGIKSLKTHGVCHEELWPYRIKDFTKKPHAKAYQEALNRKIGGYYRVDSLKEMKQSLADGFPFVFGIPIYESFESYAVERTGTVPMPKRGEEMRGGHAMVAVGYSESTKRITVRNSWGSRWGSNGYCTIPFEYMEQADDCWTVTSALSAAKLKLVK